MRKEITVTSDAGVGWCGPLLSPQLHCAGLGSSSWSSGPTSTWGSLLVAQLHCCAGCDIVQVMTSGGPDFAENCLTTQCVAMICQVIPKSTTNISMQQQLYEQHQHTSQRQIFQDRHKSLQQTQSEQAFDIVDFVEAGDGCSPSLVERNLAM